MPKRLKGKKGKRREKKAPIILPQLPQPPLPSGSKPQTQFWTKLGIAIGLISLVALIGLFPRLSASASPPTDLNDSLGSSKFTVSNDGYLKVTDVVSACFLWNVQMGGFPGPTVNLRSGVVKLARPNESQLEPAESYTIPCTHEGKPMFDTPEHQGVKLAKADLAIVAYYRIWPFTFYRGHRLFRFVAHVGSHGEVTWEKQPAAVLEPDFDNWLAIHGGSFPPELPRPPR
jgi:hypothetical protein